MSLKAPSVESWFDTPTAVVAQPPSAATGTNSGDRLHRDSVAVPLFDTASDRDWCELIRDVVALANSGGGVVTINCPLGQRSSDPNCPRTIDMAASDVVHRLARYADGNFAAIEFRTVDRTAVEITVGGASVPMSFTAAGTYDDPDRPGETGQAFAAGTFYFRHNGVSEPGNTADMRAVLQRSLRQIRKRWLRGMRRVMALPGERAYLRRARRGEQRAERSAAIKPVRIVTDPDAPALQPQDVDHLYPWRQKDLVRELNARLGRRALTSYDVQAVRRQHHLDERPDFVFHLEGAGRRYSPAVADWILEQQRLDPEFFQHARAADHEMLRLRRQRPR
jgi:hypothetical protein